MAMEVQKQSQPSVSNIQNIKESKIEDLIKSAEKQKDFMFEMIKAKMKNFIPSEDGDSSDAMNQHFSDSSKITEIDMNVSKMKLMHSEQKEAKANRYLEKEVQYNGNGRNAKYTDNKAKFFYNIRDGLLPEGHKELFAHIIVKDKYGKQVCKTTREAKVGNNDFIFTGQEEGSRKAFNQAEYSISVDLEYKINGKKQNYHELADYAEEVVDVKDCQLIFANKQKISTDEVVKHSKIKSEKEKKEEEAEKLFAWNELLGKNVSFKEKNSASGVSSASLGRVISVQKDPTTGKPNTVKIITESKLEKTVKIEDVNEVFAIDEKLDKNYHKSVESGLIEEGRNYFGSVVFLEKDEFKYNGGDVELSATLDGYPIRVVFYDKNGNEVKSFSPPPQEPPQAEDLADESWNKIQELIHQRLSGGDIYNINRTKGIYNGSLRENTRVKFDDIKHLIRVKNSKPLPYAFKIKDADLPKGEYSYKIFTEVDGKEQRIDINHIIDGYGVDKTKDGAVLSLQYTDNFTKERRSITPSQITSLGTPPVA